MATVVSKTRTVRSIPLNLLRQGKILKIPLYYLLLSSDVARETIENQGSGRLLDMLYANQSSGRYGVGSIIDRFMLNLPISRAFQNRFEITKGCLINEVTNYYSPEAEVQVLSLPCGFSRDILDCAAVLNDRRIKMLGLDLDSRSVLHSRSEAARRGITAAHFIQQDIYEFLEKAEQQFDIILTNGFADYLPAGDATSYYIQLRRVLKPGGRVITSGIGPHPHMDSLLRDFADATGQYRTTAEVHAVLSKAGFQSIRLWTESRNVITMALCQ